MNDKEKLLWSSLIVDAPTYALPPSSQDIEAMKASLVQHGVLESLHFLRQKDGVHVVRGHLRATGFQELVKEGKLKDEIAPSYAPSTVPTYIMISAAPTREAEHAANAVRRDYKPCDRAVAIGDILAKRKTMSQEELAQRVCASQPLISAFLAIRAYPLLWASLKAGERKFAPLHKLAKSGPSEQSIKAFLATKPEPKKGKAKGAGTTPPSTVPHALSSESEAWAKVSLKARQALSQDTTLAPFADLIIATITASTL